MKKYIGCLIVLLLIFIPRTNSKYVLSSDKNLGVNTPKFKIIETTNGPLTINDNKKDYLEIKFENKEEKDVKGYIEIDGVKVKDITVPASSEETYKINIDDALYQKLVECDIYPVKVKYTSPYNLTSDVTTIKKASLTIHGRVKCMNLGNAKELGIDYSKINSETNGEGVYLFDETKNDINPVYFFRGTHELKNNLLYANLCWKIVRTTETGGVRVIYNGNPVNGKCTNTTGTNTQIGTISFNKSYNKKQFVGYMYGDDTNPYQNNNDSDFKKYIDNWYKTNIKDKGFESILDKGSIYCGDRTEGSVVDGRYQPYAGRDRIITGKPTMKCPSNDSYGTEEGNRKLKYPVALLSVDEVNLSGANWTSSNSNYYLYTTNDYWLLSPDSWYSSGFAYMLGVDRNGEVFSGGDVRYTGGVRPALTLKGELPVLEGDGSKDKPFVMTKKRETLYNKIKSKSLGNDKAKGIDYSKVNSSTNGEGVYLFDETKNDTNPVYFYRGTHNLKNNLLYANLCWKIVRTTETGGVRVIYNGAPVNGKCTNTTGTNTQIGTSKFNPTYTVKQHVGYMYGDDYSPYQNINDSNIKKYIDNWYKSNIKDKGFESRLDKGSIYCGDRTEYPDSKYYGLETIIKDKRPSLKCPVNDSYGVEAGNRKLTYPVALLSVDDVMLAGGPNWSVNANVTNYDYYLSTKNDYWLLSPSNWNISARSGLTMRVMFVANYGGFSHYHVECEYGVRPAITIASSASLLLGDGSQNDPYVI